MHPLLYEINTRSWLAELSERAGRRLTLAEIPDSEFASWQHNGFTHIWLMGVWTLGARGRASSREYLDGLGGDLSREDIAGSPYAVCGYTVSRTLGGGTALAKFRRKLNEHGLKLLLDFIPNHTAIDHPWVHEHPEFYVTSEARRKGTVKPFRGATKWFAYGDCGHGSPWMDTLQLDYRHPELRGNMIDVLQSISEKCDGVRCDMAMLVLSDVFARTWSEFPSAQPPMGVEFWKEAIECVRASHPDFLFLAEAYWDLEARLQELGFDFTYNKRLYDRLIAHDASGVGRHLQSLPSEFLARSAHFIENHDEPRIASLLSFEEHRTAALLILALPGMRFLHEGQLSGALVHANVHFARRVLEDVQPNVAAFYRRLLTALQGTSIGRGQWMLLDPHRAWPENSTHQHFVIVQWQSRATFDLAVVNLSGVPSQCYVRLSAGLAGQDWRLCDSLGTEVHERNGTELAARGLFLDVPAYAAQLFRVTASY